jgi:hypothetical protein
MWQQLCDGVVPGCQKRRGGEMVTERPNTPALP